MTDEARLKYGEVLELIAKQGLSLTKACETVKCSRSRFLKECDNNEELRHRYARACEDRADRMFEEIIDICEEGERNILDDPATRNAQTQRDKLRIDARKWVLSKMQPKKYGDKLDVTSDGKQMNQVSIMLPDNKREDAKEE